MVCLCLKNKGSAVRFCLWPLMLHIIPAAGKATRIGGIPKFLLPIDEKKFLLDFHVNSVSLNNENLRKVIAVSKEFYETVHRMDFNAELVVVETKTMNETVLEVINLFPDEKNYLLTMPDTYFNDADLVNKMYKQYQDNVEGTLGIWKILQNQKGKLGQCKINKSHVINIKDKDVNCRYDYFWGAIMWNSTLNKYISKHDAHIGFMAEKSIDAKHLINFQKAQKKYFDCGTFESYKELLLSKN